VAADQTLGRSRKVGRTPFPRAQDRSLRAFLGGREVLRDALQPRERPDDVRGLKQPARPHAKGLRSGLSLLEQESKTPTSQCDEAVPAGRTGER
jgi:hypothetical protein